ncbi:hypothetical protein D9M69_498690 [compost metagenome]
MFNASTAYIAQVKDAFYRGQLVNLTEFREAMTQRFDPDRNDAATVFLVGRDGNDYAVVQDVNSPTFTVFVLSNLLDDDHGDVLDMIECGTLMGALHKMMQIVQTDAGVQ